MVIKGFEKDGLWDKHVRNFPMLEKNNHARLPQ